jgi:dihydrofolate reductase
MAIIYIYNLFFTKTFLIITKFIIFFYREELITMNNSTFLNIIVAVDKNWGIGRNNRLLTYLKGDMEYFRTVTQNSIVVMGYNTYLSLPKKPLSNRINIVLTKKNISLQDCFVINNINDLFKLLETININNEKNVFVIGGSSIYKQLIAFCNKLYITHINHIFHADTFFPQINENDWIVETIHPSVDIKNDSFEYVFKIYTRK